MAPTSIAGRATSQPRRRVPQADLHCGNTVAEINAFGRQRSPSRIQQQVASFVGLEKVGLIGARHERPHGSRIDLFGENCRTNSTNPPDGQNTPNPVNPPSKKYSDLQKLQRRSIFLTIPSRHGGRFAIVTDVRWGCGGRRRCDGRARLRRTVKSCGPGSPTLESSSWDAKALRDDGGKKARSPGRTRSSR